MRTGRRVAVVTVTAEQRLELEPWSRRPKTTQALAISTTPHSVGKWRKRFASLGNDGLLDEPRPGTSRKLSDKQVELVLARTLDSQPEGARHALVDAGYGQGLRAESVPYQPHLTRLFSGTPSQRDLQAFPRSAVHRRCATSLACILTRPIAPWSYAWTRRVRYRRWIEPHRYYPCVRGRSNAESVESR